MTEQELRELSDIEGGGAGDCELEADELMPCERVLLELDHWPRDEL